MALIIGVTGSIYAENLVATVFDTYTKTNLPIFPMGGGGY